MLQCSQLVSFSRAAVRRLQKYLDILPEYCNRRSDSGDWLSINTDTAVERGFWHLSLPHRRVATRLINLALVTGQSLQSALQNPSISGATVQLCRWQSKGNSLTRAHASSHICAASDLAHFRRINDISANKLLRWSMLLRLVEVRAFLLSIPAALCACAHQIAFLLLCSTK